MALHRHLTSEPVSDGRAANMSTLPKVPWGSDELMAAIIPVDEAFRNMEWKWGVGRLERLVSEPTLASFRRGWIKWKEAINSNTVPMIRLLAPLMIAALSYMDQEATNLGHKQLAAEVWEHRLSDDTVLVVVRTTAEASRIARAVNLNGDGSLPPDLASVIEHQRAGRELIVWTMGELARVLPEYPFDTVDMVKRCFPGALIVSGPTIGENDAADWVSGDDLRAVIEDYVPTTGA
jgi:hypothetical protein